MKKCRTPPHIKYTHTHSMWCINLKFLLSCPKAANIFFVFYPFNLSASHTKSDRIGLFSKKEKRNEKKGKEKNGERRSDFGIFPFSSFISMSMNYALNKTLFSNRFDCLHHFECKWKCVRKTKSIDLWEIPYVFDHRFSQISTLTNFKLIKFSTNQI